MEIKLPCSLGSTGGQAGGRPGEASVVRRQSLSPTLHYSSNGKTYYSSVCSVRVFENVPAVPIGSAGAMFAK